MAGWADRSWIALEGIPPKVVGDTRDPRHDGTYHDDLGLRALLDTRWLKLVAEGPFKARLEISPDRMVDLRELMYPDEYEFASALVAPGVDRHELSLLSDSGIIESWTTYVDGRVARRHVLTSLTAH